MYDSFLDNSFELNKKIQNEVDSSIIKFIETEYGFVCNVLKVNFPMYQIAYLDKANNETFSNDPAMQMKLYTRCLSIHEYPFMDERTITAKIDPFVILNKAIYNILYPLIYTEVTELNHLQLGANNDKNWLYMLINMIESKFYSIEQYVTAKKYIIISSSTHNNEIWNDFVTLYKHYIESNIDLYELGFFNLSKDKPFVKLGSLHNIDIYCDVWDKSNRITCGFKEQHNQQNITCAYYKAELAKPSFSLLANDKENIEYTVPTVRLNIDKNNPTGCFSISFDIKNNGYKEQYDYFDKIKENNDIYLI